MPFGEDISYLAKASVIPLLSSSCSCCKTKSIILKKQCSQCFRTRICLQCIREDLCCLCCGRNSMHYAPVSLPPPYREPIPSQEDYRSAISFPGGSLETWMTSPPYEVAIVQPPPFASGTMVEDVQHMHRERILKSLDSYFNNDQRMTFQKFIEGISVAYIVPQNYLFNVFDGRKSIERGDLSKMVTFLLRNFKSDRVAITTHCHLLEPKKNENDWKCIPCKRIFDCSVTSFQCPQCPQFNLCKKCTSKYHLHKTIEHIDKGDWICDLCGVKAQNYFFGCKECNLAVCNGCYCCGFSLQEFVQFIFPERTGEMLEALHQIGIDTFASLQIKSGEQLLNFGLKRPDIRVIRRFINPNSITYI
jgi:hypothetical protein